MKRAQIPEVLLSSGHKMPLIGMGTVAVPLPPPETLVPVFINGIESGYRHFDSAALYGSEESLGQAVAEALDRGLISSREDLFITSKLWCPDAHRDLVLPALKKSLQRLRLEYVDLYLIHMPARVKQEVEGLNFSEEDLLPFDIKGTWEAMEECSRLGLCKSIGVCNFSSKKISQLLEHATISPAVNQIATGGNECRVATEKIGRILQRERNSRECMVSFGSQWSFLGFSCSDGESNS